MDQLVEFRIDNAVLGYKFHSNSPFDIKKKNNIDLTCYFSIVAFFVGGGEEAWREFSIAMTASYASCTLLPGALGEIPERELLYTKLCECDFTHSHCELSIHPGMQIEK